MSHLSAFDQMVLACMVGAYFLPSWIAATRDAVGTGRIFVINLLFGWTFFIWAVLMFMAVYSPQREIETVPFSRATPVRIEPRLPSVHRP